MKSSILFATILAVTIGVITYRFVTNNNVITNQNNPKHKVAVLADIKIGGQYWINKYLNVIKFKNGAAIPYAVNASHWKSYAEQVVY